MANTTPGSSQSTPQPEALAPLRLREAYDATAAERAALDANDLVPIRIDVTSAVTTALGCIPKIAPFRSAIASTMPAYDLGPFDKLERYALALMHAQTKYHGAIEPEAPIEALSKEAVALREVLLADVTALETRKLLDVPRSELVGPIGYKNQVADLLLLVNALRGKWSVVAGRCGVTAEELDRAEVVADRLLTAAGAREQAPKSALAEADTRMRAYTLFVNAHDEVRRVLTFLRWREDDLEQIFPTLFNIRGRRGAKAKAAEEEVVTPTAPAPGASNGNGSNGNGTSNGAAKPAAPASSGMAGSDPFVK